MILGDRRPRQAHTRATAATKSPKSCSAISRTCRYQTYQGANQIQPVVMPQALLGWLSLRLAMIRRS